MCCVPFPFQNVKGQSHTCRLNFCGRSGGILVGYRSKISSWVLLKLASYSNEHVLSDNNGIPTGSTFLGFFVLSCRKDGNGGLGDLVYGGRSRGVLATNIRQEHTKIGSMQRRDSFLLISTWLRFKIVTSLFNGKIKCHAKCYCSEKYLLQQFFLVTWPMCVKVVVYIRGWISDWHVSNTKLLS